MNTISSLNTLIRSDGFDQASHTAYRLNGFDVEAGYSNTFTISYYIDDQHNTRNCRIFIRNIAALLTNNNYVVEFDEHNMLTVSFPS